MDVTQLMVFALLMFAPAPLAPPKPTVRPCIMDVAWECKWSSLGGIMRFGKDGSYFHQMPDGDSLYVGAWSMVKCEVTGADVLHVHEHMLDTDGRMINPLRWAATLDKTALSGTFGKNKSEFKLWRSEGKFKP